MRILAIDPGRTIGFSTNFKYFHYESETKLVESWQRDYTIYGDEGHAAFNQTLRALKPQVIICESFDFRQAKRGLDMIAVEYIGIIKLFCYPGTFTQLIFQNSSVKSKKGFWTDKKLKHLNLHIPGEPHAMDALKHRLHYEKEQGLLDMNLFKNLE